MIDVNWDDNAKAAVKEFAEYVGQTKHCERYLERIVPKQTKTVADAVEWAKGEWPNGVCSTIWVDGSGAFRLGSEVTNQTVCTREQFDAYLKEQEGEKWTHVVNFGFSEQAQCKIISEHGDFLWVKVDGAGCPATYKKSELKPIKPTMTKEQHEFLCKFSADSNNLEVIAEVESYLAKHDIVEVPAND